MKTLSCRISSLGTWLAACGLAAAASALAACESTRALVATPAATPWPDKAYLNVVILTAQSTPVVRPNLVYVQASDSAAATDSLPPDIASASNVALLVSGAPVPLSQGTYLPGAGGTIKKVPTLYTAPPGVATLLPRTDGTQEFRFVVDQRYVRSFVATVSVY